MSYEVEYSFSGWQAANPQKPLPAGPIDNEFSSVEIALAAIGAALGQVRRDDGKIQNGAVGWDSLDEQVRALLNTDPRVLVPDINPAAFATVGEAESGNATDRLMTPRRTRQAIDAQRPRATQEQAEVGTNNVAVMTPKRTVELLDALRPLAGEEEALDDENDAATMTPAMVVAAISHFRGAFSATVALVWSEIADGASATQDIEVEGAAAGDRVVFGLATTGIAPGLLLTAWVHAADTVRLRITNLTGGAATPTAADYSVTVLQF